MNLDHLIATGAHAKVYRDNDKAIKVFDENYSKTEVLNEALNTSRVEETGLNIPKIIEVSKIDRKWAITMDYIDGKTLAELMSEDPDNIDKYITDMVTLQIEIHSKRSALLNKLKDKMNRQINELSSIDNVKKYDLLTRLDGMPKHNKVCHGDFSPDNIIVSNGTMYVLDWVHAAQGNASADVARTYLLFALKNTKAAELYMDTFCHTSKTEKKYVQQWLPIVAAAQLTKNRPEEKELLFKWLDVIEFQ